MSRGLRIGVVLHGALVEERVIRSGPVTIGQSLRCTLSLPVDGLPREHVLFTEALELRVPPGMTSVVAGTRGKLALGDALVILFQDVALPAPAPGPQLPPSIRGTLADRVDRRLAVIVGASLAVHIGITAWAWHADVPARDRFGQTAAVEYRPDEYAIDMQLPDHVERVDPTLPSTPMKPAAATPAPHSITPARTPGRAAASDPQALAEDATRMASILTGDEGSNGGHTDLAPRAPGADLGQQIADARARNLTIGDGGHTSRTDDRAHIGTDPDRHIERNDPTFTHTQATHVEPRTRIDLEPLPGETSHSTLTVAVVLERINSLYMTGLQHCYQIGIGRDASLQGKVTVELTVDEQGHVTDPSADGLATEVDACIQHQMGSWRFPIPRDKAGAPTEATFKVSLALQRAD